MKYVNILLRVATLFKANAIAIAMSIIIFFFPFSALADDWKYCAREGSTCRFEGCRTDVRYGKGGIGYVYKTFSNSVKCNNSVFGDPAYGYDKKCYYKWWKCKTLSLSSPSGGEKWLAGTKQYIRWSCREISYISIRYSIDNGKSWKIISNSVSASSGSYYWTIPADASTNCKVRISDNDNEPVDPYATSNAFTIISAIAEIINPPETLIKTTELFLKVEGDNVTHYKYKLNDQEYSNEFEIIEDIHLTNLYTGTYTLCVLGRDESENWQLANYPTIITWTVDSPEATIDNPPENITNQTEILLMIGGGGITHYKYKLNENNYSSEIEISENLHLSNLQDGVNTLYLIGSYDLNVWQSADMPTMITWIVDTTFPQVTDFTATDMTSQYSTTTNDRTVNISMIGDDNNGIITRWLITETPDTPTINQMNEGNSNPITLYTIQSLNDGLKSLYAWNMDIAGNISQPTLAKIQLDTTAQFVITSEAVNRINNSCIADNSILLAGIMEDGAEIKVIDQSGKVIYPTYLDSKSWNIIQEDLADGEYKLTITATDKLLNQSSQNISFRKSTPITANISTSQNTLLADNGISQLNLMITIQDSLGHAVCDDASIQLFTTLGEITSDYKVLNGQLSGALKSSFDLGDAKISTKFNDIEIGSTHVEMVPGKIEKLVFIPEELNMTLDTRSKYIKLKSQDAYGHPLKVASDKVILLYSTSLNNALFWFSTDVSEENGDREIILPAGRNYLAFQYEGTQLGVHTIIAEDISGELEKATMKISITTKQPKLAILSANPSEIFANGESKSTLTITLYYEDHSTKVDDGTTVQISVDLGCQIDGSGTTKDGVMERIIIAGTQIGSPDIKLNDGEGRSIMTSWESVPINITKPEVKLIGVPDDFINSEDIRILVSGAGIVEYQYKLNDSLWSNVRDVNYPIDLKDLKEGSYTLQVDGKVSNDDQQQIIADISVDWVLDKTEPNINIYNPENNRTNRPVYIEGNISDYYSGILNLDLQITDGSYYMEQNGRLVNTPEWLTIAYQEESDIWNFNVSDFSFKEAQDYTVTARAKDKAGNTKTHSIIFTYGTPKDNSTITCELSTNSFVIGQKVIISGKITPKPVEVGKGISLDFISPYGDSKPDFTLADQKGEFQYDLKCNLIDRDGTWSVKASWVGDSSYEGAESPLAFFNVTKAGSEISLNLSSQSVKMDEKINIEGTLIPKPYCEKSLANSLIEIFMLRDEKPEKIHDHKIYTDELGNFKLENYKFSSLGEWPIYAQYRGNSSYTASKSDNKSVKVVKTAGYAIIVHGRDFNNDGFDDHRKTADSVYTRLTNDRGLIPKDIRYKNDKGEYILNSKNDVKYAITVWAKNKMNNYHGNLYMIMIDHGNREEFLMGNEKIKSWELSNWLNELQEEGLDKDVSSILDIIVILGFCHSGSFIDDLSGKSNRIIIASAAADEVSVRGNKGKDGIREGEFFVSEFFKSVSFGKSVYDCFINAVDKTEKYRKRERYNNHYSKKGPYFDDSKQHPLLDDNRDGIGSNNLEKEADGVISKDLYIGVSTNVNNAPGDTIITEVSETIFIDANSVFSNVFWAKVTGRTRVSTIWIEIKSPDYKPIIDEDGQQIIELTKWETSFYNEKTERFEWKKENMETDFIKEFSSPGTYQVFYYVTDRETQNVSPMMISRVYKGKSDNAAPYDFTLVSPKDDNEEKTKLVLDWTEPSKDPENDYFTYTLMLSKGDDNFENEKTICIEYITESMYLIELPSSGVDTWDDNIIYWKVQAIDEYGAIKETKVQNFKTNNTNNWPLWVEGKIYDIYSGMPISNAMIIFKSNRTFEFKTQPSGYFLGTIPSGSGTTYNIDIKADGYFDKTLPTVDIQEGATWTRYIGIEPILEIGDLNGRNGVNIDDAILALRIISGLYLDELTLEATVKGNVNIGLAEAILIMRKIANLK